MNRLLLLHILKPKYIVNKHGVVIHGYRYLYKDDSAYVKAVEAKPGKWAYATGITLSQSGFYSTLTVSADDEYLNSSEEALIRGLQVIYERLTIELENGKPKNEKDIRVFKRVEKALFTRTTRAS